MSTPQLSDEQIEALFEANKAAPGKILRVTIGRAIEQAATAAQSEALAAVTRERDALLEFFDADEAVSRVYDEVSPGLSSVPAGHTERLRLAVERRSTARATLTPTAPGAQADQGGDGPGKG